MRAVSQAATGAETRRVLGRTGREVFRLGVSASYGLGGADLERAVEEHGVDYLYWGSMRTRAFGLGLRALCARGLRDRLFVVIQSYSRLGSFVAPSLRRALRWLGIERADLLLLGYWNKQVPPRIVDAAIACRERGLTAHVGVSTHERPEVPGFAAAGSPFDVIHFRYNAANRGAERDLFPRLPLPPRAGLVAFTTTRWGQLLRRPRGAPEDLPIPSAGDCYRFALTNPYVDAVVTGPADAAQVAEAAAAIARGPMDPDELEWMRQVGDLAYAQGGLKCALQERF